MKRIPQKRDGTTEFREPNAFRDHTSEYPSSQRTDYEPRGDIRGSFLSLQGELDSSAAHNHAPVGSNPTPATISRGLSNQPCEATPGRVAGHRCLKIAPGLAVSKHECRGRFETVLVGTRSSLRQPRQAHTTRTDVADCCAIPPGVNPIATGLPGETFRSPGLLLGSTGLRLTRDDASSVHPPHRSRVPFHPAYQP